MIKYSPKGNVIGVACQNQIFLFENQRLFASCRGHVHAVLQFDWSEDGTMVRCAPLDGVNFYLYF